MRETTSYRLADAVAARSDRDAMFRKGLDYLGRNAIPGTLHERPYRFHWNINLYIETLAHCNCRCRFCINHVNYQQVDIPEDRFIERLGEVLALVHHLDPSVQLVGGEPTLAPRRVGRIFELIRRHRLRKPVITTNGSGLEGNRGLFDEIGGALAHLNISRHHDDDRRLVDLTGFDNPLTNEALARLLREWPLAEKIRLNCCLLNEGIRSHADIERYLGWALDLGVRNVCFATLSRLPTDYFYDPELVRQTVTNAVDFAAIMDDVTADPRFRFVKFHSGSHCMYEVWEYQRSGRPCAVVFATSNNHFARELDGIADLVELLVFHSDGTLAASWNKALKVI